MSAACADSVLAFLRANNIAEVERLMGKPIKRYPPALGCQYGTIELFDRMCDAIRVSAPDVSLVALIVRPRDLKRTKQVAPQLDEIIEGRTVAQMLQHGVKMRTIKQASRDGWLVLGKRKEAACLSVTS